MKWINLLLVVSMTAACNSKKTSIAKEEAPKTSKLVKHIPIGDYVTGTYEDAAGHRWFARDGYGAYQYDGTAFTHYRKQDGLLSNNVMEITFDEKGHVWFGMRVVEKDHPERRSGQGSVNQLVDGEIISFLDIDGFTTNDVYEIHKDRLGNIWIATVKNGVYKYDGMTFQHFEVPIFIMSITDDQNGNIWLGGAGGLYKIDKEGQIMEVTVQGPWE